MLIQILTYHNGKKVAVLTEIRPLRSVVLQHWPGTELGWERIDPRLLEITGIPEDTMIAQMEV